MKLLPIVLGSALIGAAISKIIYAPDPELNIRGLTAIFILFLLSIGWTVRLLKKDKRYGR